MAMILLFNACNDMAPSAHPINLDGLIVRLSEITVVPQHLAAYKAILKEEAATSIQLEPGVISIFPMFGKTIAHP